MNTDQALEIAREYDCSSPEELREAIRADSGIDLDDEEMNALWEGVTEILEEE